MPKKLFFIAMALILSLLIACGDQAEPNRAASGTEIEGFAENDSRPEIFQDISVDISPEERELMKIAVAPVDRSVISDNISRDGRISVHPDKVAKVGPVISGRAKELLVGLGGWVEAGQPMAVLVSEQVSNALSEFYKAIQELELSEADLQRYRRLMEQEIGARKDLLAAEAEYKIAQATVNAAEKTLHALGFTESDVQEIKETHKIDAEIVLRAPIAGRVVERNVTLGERVGEESNLFTIMDLRTICVEAQIYEADIHKVRVGQKVEITAPGLPGRTFEGTVVYVDNQIDPDSRTLKVRSEIANPEEALKVGMYAKVVVHLGGSAEKLCVPKQAVFDFDGGSYVFVPDNDQFRMVRIETGSADTAYTEIVQGVNEGDSVVTTGGYELLSKARRQARHRLRGGR
jgi:cobalt-zinc-cadmium efflux system membrane fusion protein